MSCALTRDILNVCGENFAGGTDEIWLIEKSAIVKNGVDVDASGTVTAIALQDGKRFFQYEFPVGTAFYNQEYSVADGGAGGYQHTLTFNLKGLKAETRLELQTLANIKTVALVKDVNEKWQIVGWYGAALTLSANTAQTGQSFTDLNGYSGITLSTQSANMAPFVTQTAINDLLGEEE